jgi:broad specificity phosphatase PhoE
MKKMHSFWLIRHALVDAAALQFLYGTNDVPLCETSLAATSETYRALAARLPRGANFVCTPLSRTQRTADAIFAAGYPACTPEIDPAFIEQDFGDFQGLPIADFDSRATGQRHPFWPIGSEETPPNGENFAAMRARVGAGLTRLAATPGETIIVSHGGAIRAACAFALDLNAHQALSLAVENLSLTRLAYHPPHGWRILSVNEHLSTLTCENPSESSPLRSHLESTSE